VFTLPFNMLILFSVERVLKLILYCFCRK